MVQVKRKKRNWVRTIMFYLLLPPIVWVVAFIMWFYWYDLARLFSKADERPNPTAKIEAGSENRERPKAAPTNRSQEKILDEERKKLENILKQRQ